VPSRLHDIKGRGDYDRLTLAHHFLLKKGATCEDPQKVADAKLESAVTRRGFAPYSSTAAFRRIRSDGIVALAWGSTTARGARPAARPGKGGAR